MEQNTNYSQNEKSLRTIGELKDSALATLRGRWSEAVIFTLAFIAIFLAWVVFYYVCTFLAVSQKVGLWLPSIVMYGGLLFLVVQLRYGFANAFVIAEREDDAVRTENLFMAFKNIDIYFSVLIQYVAVGILIHLWSLLLIIPGIVKSYSYAMFPYIRRDYPNLTTQEVISLSQKMMSGHKWDLFLLHLSFIGWGVLNVLTCFIGSLWLNPYVLATNAQFYKDVREEYIRNHESSITY